MNGPEWDPREWEGVSRIGTETTSHGPTIDVTELEIDEEIILGETGPIRLWGLDGLRKFKEEFDA